MTRRLRILPAVMVLACAFAAAQLPGRERPPASPSGQYSIAGQLVDSISGKPLDSATVVIAPTEHQNDRTAVKTSADGKFAFTGLRPQKYSLSATRRGYPAQGFEQHEQYSSAIAVGEGIDSTNLVFRLRPGATIRGTVLDEANEPVAGALIRLFATQFFTGHRSTRMVTATQTDDLGAYSFSKLPEGPYYIAVTAQPWYTRQFQGMRHGFGGSIAMSSPAAPPIEDEQKSKLDVAYPLTFYDAVRDSSQASAIDLSAGDRFEANFQLVAEPAVHVTVGSPAPVAEEPPPPEGAAPVETPAAMRRRRPTFVRLSYLAFDGMTIPLNQGGSYGDGSSVVSAGVAAGHYVLEISLPNDTRPVFEEIDLTSDIDLRGINIPPTASVAGVVQLNGAAPKGLTAITLRNPNSQRGYGARLDASGEFKFEQGILPGTYDLAIGSPSSDIYIQNARAKGARLVGRALTVGEGATISLNIAAGEGLAKVDGVVQSEGHGFAGAMVVLVPKDPAHAELLFRRDQSDSDGTFTLLDVVPGQYTVVAIRDGWKLSWADPNVLASYLPSGTKVEVGPKQALNIHVDLK